MSAPVGRRCILLVVAIVVGAWSAAAVGAELHEPALQTRPWRVAVAGSYATGYMGLLARHGMPRERLLDSQLTDSTLLAQYQIIIVTDTRQARTSALLAQTIKDYVREGGIAIVEPTAIMLQNVIPGARVAVGSGGSLVWSDATHPISKAFAPRGPMPVRGWSVIALVPEDETDMQVLAKFTGTRSFPSRSRSRSAREATLTEAPAIILTRMGEGYLLYVGIGVGRMLALQGPMLEDFVLAAIRHFSDGQLVPRFSSPSLSARPLTQALGSGSPQPLPAAPPGGEQEAVPEGFETLQSEAAVPDFNLTAPLAKGGEAEILFDYWNAQWHRSLSFDGNAVGLRRTAEGKSETIRRGEPIGEDGEILVKRRAGSITVLLGDRPILTAADGAPWQGAIACRNMPEADVQPVVPPYFRDDFMRREGDFGGWEAVGGTWKVESTEGTPQKGANPFSYEFATASEAIATAGHWFWDEYALTASAKWLGGAAGLACHYEGPEKYVLFEVWPGDGAGVSGTASLVRVRDGEREVLAEKPVQCGPAQWYRLGLRASGGWISGVLDGRIVVEAEDALRGQGQVALYADDSQGHFDDVDVRPWHAVVQRAGASILDDLGPVSGEWTDAEGATLQGRAKGKAAALAIASAPDWDRVSCSAMVRPRDGTAGLCLRYRDEDNHYLLTVSGGRKGTVRLTRIADGRPSVVAEERHGSGEDGWWRLRAEVQGPRITVLVDDERMIEVADASAGPAGAGLCVRGKRAAEFREVRFVPLEDAMRVADPPTPNFAGIVDRHTWAGTAGSWLPQAEAVGRFWHHARFPGDARLSVGVHADRLPKVAVHAILGDGSHPDAGYRLTATHTWRTGQVALALYREGEIVATKGATIDARAKSFLLRLERAGKAIIGALDGEALLVHNDPEPLGDLDRLGVEATGTRLWAEDIAVESDSVTSYVFDNAPVDWLVESGTWEIARRWECQKEWTWFAGWDDELAVIRNKHRFVGDMVLNMYVGPKMMELGASGLPTTRPGTPAAPNITVRNRRYREELSDIHIGLCRQQGDAEAGYTFVIAGQEHPGAVLKKDGQVVARSSEFVIPQGGIHNDWVEFAVRKSGDVVGLYCYGQPVVEYADPEPVPGGYFSIGTYHNAILVPRVTVYGGEEPIRPATLPTRNES